MFIAHIQFTPKKITIFVAFFGKPSVLYLYNMYLDIPYFFFMSRTLITITSLDQKNSLFSSANNN